MGMLDKLRTKKERLVTDPETGKAEWKPREGDPRYERQQKYDYIESADGSKPIRVRKDIKELTHEEQHEPRQHPWQTPRGKRVIKNVKGGVKRIDNAVVNYNRTRNPVGRQPRQRMSNYSTHNNYNPFGSMFDTGMNYNRPRKKSSGKTKYTVVGGKAYPIAGSKKKKKQKSKRRQSNDWDVFGAFGGYKL